MRSTNSPPSSGTRDGNPPGSPGNQPGSPCSRPSRTPVYFSWCCCTCSSITVNHNSPPNNGNNKTKDPKTVDIINNYFPENSDRSLLPECKTTATKITWIPCVGRVRPEDSVPPAASRCDEEVEVEVPESLTPTPEEILSWQEGFDNVMRCPAGRQVFREFLKLEYSEENILFWNAVDELKKETNAQVIEEKARMIYEDFISILSPREVSLDSRVREIVNRNMVQPDTRTFDDAQEQIYMLMKRDSYPRFVNSSLYRRLMETLQDRQA